MKRLIPLAIASLAMLTACNEDTKNLHIQANTTIPLGTVAVNTEKLLTLANIEDQIKPNKENVVQYTMTDNNQLIDETNFDQILDIQNQHFIISIGTSGIPSTPGTPEFITIPPKTKTVEFKGLEGKDIKEIILQKGLLSIQTTGNNDQTKLIITIPQITKNNIPITLNCDDSLILDDTYSIKPNNNTIDVVLTGEIHNTATSIDLDVKIDIDKVKSAKGFFGRKEMAVLETSLSIDKDEFSTFLYKTDFIRFANPQINITINNTFNVPIMAKITKISINGIPIEFKTGLGNDRFLLSDKEGTSLLMSNAQTVNGKGLSDAITKDFKSIEIAIATIINPTADDLQSNNNIAPTNNSINNTDKVTATYDIEIPFDLTIQNLSITDKTEVDLAELLPSEHQYNEIAFAIAGKNSLPLTLIVDAYVTHNNLPDGEKIHLFDKGFEVGSTANRKDPFIIERTKPIIKTVNAETIKQLLQSKSLYFELTASTTGVKNGQDPSKIQPVKLFLDSELELNITLGAEADISLN